MWHSSQKNDVNSPCVLLAYDLCPQHFLSLSIFSVLDNFCQIAPLHSNVVWMTRVLHLICKAHTRILLFGAKFHILAMYVQMLDIYQKYQKKIWYFGYFQQYHDIFQPWWCCCCCWWWCWWTDDADDILKLCDMNEMSEEEQLQWAMKESVKSSSRLTNDIRPLPSDGV